MLWSFAVRRTARLFSSWHAAASTPIVCLAAACGGAPVSDLLTNTGAGDASGIFGEQDAGGGNDATGGADATVDHDEPIDTGSVRDTGPAQVDSSGDEVMEDTGPGDAAPDPGVACGSGTYCTPSVQTCCISTSGFGGMQRRCSNGNTCGSGTPVHCDDTADCPSGQVCCGSVYANVYTDVSCRMSCVPSPIGLTTNVRFCDPNNNDCPSTAPNCKMSTIITGYTVCGM
jgi:hypothetical protein